MDTDRRLELRAILTKRRREIVGEIQGKVRQFRDQNIRRRPDSGESGEALSSSDFGVQEDIELALIEMKADTAIKIEEALQCLEEGTYGHCSYCGEEISENRLRALPFAIRCKECEDAREAAEQRRVAGRGSAVRMLFISDDEKLDP